MVYDIIVGRNESDRKKFENKGTIFIGKSYVKMGQTTSLSNNIFMDVIRSHVVFVVGKRGGGKCLTGDSLITLEDGSQSQIKDLATNSQKVLSLNNKLKIQKTAKDDFFSRTVNKLIKLKLRSGKEIKLTPEHPLLTIDGWVATEDLNIKDRIATPRKTNAFGKENIKDEIIKLLAYLIAEGHTKKVVLFSNTDPKIIKDFKESLNLFDSNLTTKEDQPGCFRIIEENYKSKILDQTKVKKDHLGRFTKGSKTINQKRSIRQLIEKYNLFGKLAIEKEIPQEIIKLPQQKLALFLNKLFSCDGSIYKDKKRWESCYSSSSKKLIKQVHHLLLKFGILSKIRTKKIKYNNEIKISYELVINEENTQKFIEKIGFFGEKKEKTQKFIIETKNNKRNPNIDTIPKGIWNLYKPQNWAHIGRELGYAHPKAMRERIKYCPSRQMLLQISKVEENNFLKTIATSDIFWDEIQSLEVLTGEFKVYDISIPKFHNFIANDIIVHNSYSAGVIAEGMINLPDEISKNLSIIMLDTMGIYWTMKYPNEKDTELLEEWKLKPKGLEKIKIFAPIGYYQQALDDGIPVDEQFSIKASELTGEDWRLAFELDPSHPVTILIEKILGDFAENKIHEFNIDDMIKSIRSDHDFSNEAKNEAINRLKVSKRWGLFSEQGTKIDTLIIGGKVSVLDVSAYATEEGGWGVKSLVIGLIAKKIFIERMISRKLEEIEAIKTGYSYFQMEEEVKEDQKPLVWFMLDEAHEMLPAVGKTAATDALVTILREGRQPGLSLLLITQQPGKIHSDVMTQSDIVLAHRLTAKKDVDALNSMMQSYLGDTLTGYLNMLPSEKGAAIILDDNSERLYPMKVRPKFSWHGGEAPTALKYKKSLHLKI